MRIAVTLLLFAAAPLFGDTAPVPYRLDAVKRHVVLTTSAGSSVPAVGQLAHGGDRVRTGWFSYARIGSQQHNAHFEIFASTEVTLAANEPGVILSLERGRIEAIFDKITGSEPRVVKTPGALLAVRGTRYHVEVDGSGHTTVNVFEGIVEVQSALRNEPLLVHAGQAAAYGRREPPSHRPMTRRDRPADRRPSGERHDGGDMMPRDGQRPSPDRGRPAGETPQRPSQPPRSNGGLHMPGGQSGPRGGTMPRPTPPTPPPTPPPQR